METPWQLASRIPGDAKKTVLDHWNGYHSVPLDGESMKYTVFLTPYGRYRYKKAAQGCNISGDGFNERVHNIFMGFKNRVACVDDAAVWTKGEDPNEHFLKVAEYLNVCAGNGIVLNPNKFQICKDEVVFAGFRVGKENIKPCEKTLKAIENFPTPKDISGVRAWFGLVNQVSYALTSAYSSIGAIEAIGTGPPENGGLQIVNILSNSIWQAL